MQNLKKHTNKIIIIVVSVFIITFAYNFITKDKNENKTSIENVVNETLDNEASKILQTLNELEEIEINSDFFNEDLSASSTNLVSFHDLENFVKEEIKPEPVGKNNPFLDSYLFDNTQEIEQVDNIIAETKETVIVEEDKKEVINENSSIVETTE